MSLHFDDKLAGEYLNYPKTAIDSAQTPLNTESLTERRVVNQSIQVYDLVSSDEESSDNSTNPNVCRPLSVRIVDCNTYPWYYKKYKISSIVDEPVNEEDFVDDLIKLDFNMAQHNTQSSYSHLKSDTVKGSLPAPEIKKENKKQKNETNENKLSEINFRKNTGLVGLKIMPLIDLRNDKKSSNSDTIKNKNKVDKYILEFNSALQNVSTVIVPVSNSENSHKVSDPTDEKVSEKVKASEVISDADKIRKKKPYKSKKSEKSENNKKSEKRDRSDKSEKSEKSEKGEKSERAEKSEKSKKGEKSDLQKNEVSKPITEKEKTVTVTSPVVKQSDVKDKRKTNKYLNDLIKRKNEAMDIIKKLKKIRDACNTIKNNKSLSATSIIKKALCDDLNENLSEDKVTSAEGSQSPVLPCNVNVTSKLTTKTNTNGPEIKKPRDTLIQMIDNIGRDILKDESKDARNEIQVSSKEDISEPKITENEAVTNESKIKETEEKIVITDSQSQLNPLNDYATSIVVSTHQKSTKDQSLEQTIAKPATITFNKTEYNNTPGKSKKGFAYVPPNQRVRRNIPNNIPVVTSSSTRNGPDFSVHYVGGKEVLWKKIPHYHSASAAAAASVSNPNAFPHNFVTVQSNYNPRYHYNIFKAMPPLTNMNRYDSNIYHPYWNQFLAAPPPPPPPLPQQAQRNVSKEQTCIRILKNKPPAPGLTPGENNSIARKDSICYEKTTNRMPEIKTNLTPVKTKSEMLKELEKGIVDLNHAGCKDTIEHSEKNSTDCQVNVDCGVALATESLSNNISVLESSGNSINGPARKNDIRDLAQIIYKTCNNIPPKKRLDGLVKDLSMKASNKVNVYSYNTYNGRHHKAVAPQTRNDNLTGKLNSTSAYSPPILPIPTYQSTLDILSRANYESQKSRPLPNDTRKEYVRAKLVQVPIETDVNNLYHTNEGSTKKISLQEYQKRISQPYHNPNVEMRDSPRAKRAKSDNGRPNLPNLVPIIFNHDQDLGYDSDVTVKI